MSTSSLDRMDILSPDPITVDQGTLPFAICVVFNGCDLNYGFDAHWGGGVVIHSREWCRYCL